MNHEEARLWAQLRFQRTVRQIDNRAITPHEDRLQDKLTAIVLKRALTEVGA